MLLEILDDPKPFDINFQDGLGNTALHYAVSNGSTSVLEYILTHEGCDVDPINRIDRATPLHLAVGLEDPELRAEIVESLLEAGADYRIRNKNGQTAQELVKSDDYATLDLFRQAQAEASISREDIAHDDEDDVASGDSD